MIPEALIVALSGSVSNHWSRKSAALVVISWMKTACCSWVRSLKARARRATGSHSRGWKRPGSGVAVVVHPPEVVVLERGEGPVEREDLESVLRQLELADDLGAEQRDDVRGDAEPEAREHLF